MFNARPTHPIIRMSIGFCTPRSHQYGSTTSNGVVLCSETNRSTDCKKMLTPSATRKVPLKKAPRSEALCQPNDNASGEFSRSDILVEGSVGEFGDDLW
jgi:hypothetical protein